MAVEGGSIRRNRSTALKPDMLDRTNTNGSVINMKCCVLASIFLNTHLTFNARNIMTAVFYIHIPRLNINKYPQARKSTTTAQLYTYELDIVCILNIR